jgi:hypothetical protein
VSRGRSWLFGAAWLAVGAAAALGAVLVAINLTSPAWLRVVLVLALVLACVAALMLGSDSIAEALDGRTDRWGDRLFWLTSSIVALAALVLLGLPAMAVAPDTPGAGNVLEDAGIDVVVGLLGGALAALVTVAVAALLGRAIWRFQRAVRPEERARRWRPPPAGAVWGTTGRSVLRGAALGLCGLLLSAVCLAVVTTLTTNHNGAVDAPARQEQSVLLTVVLPVAAFAAGSAIAWWVAKRWLRLDPHRGLRHGTHASALAACLVLLVVVLTAGGVEGSARRALWSGPRSVVPSATVAGALTGSPALARTFEPRLAFAGGEHWHPTSVAWYLRQNPRPFTGGPFCNARAADGRVPGCYRLPCDDAAGACAPDGSDAAALYYRYAPAPGGALVQYWIFYDYDSLDTPVITQWHQSDWEQVSVLVARSGSTVRPAEVAYSEHCYGSRLPADRVRWAGGTHPVVYVADGSHANYPRPVDVPVRQLRCSLGLTPRYLGVAGLFYSPAVDGSRLEIPFGYASGLRDHTTAGPPGAPLPLLALSAAPEITGFAGHWGLDNDLSPLGIGRLASSAGPPAPQTQDAWVHPFAAMLCSERWLSPPGTRAGC